MASRRKTETSSPSLFGEQHLAPVAREEVALPIATPIDVARAAETPETAEAPQPSAPAPKLRVVPKPAEVPESEVIIEQQADGRYVVSLLRDHGTTVAAVVYTRAQLELLMRRIPAALEVG